MTSGNASRAPRYVDAATPLEAGQFVTFDIESSSDYFDAVAEQGIILDRDERREEVGQFDKHAEVGHFGDDGPESLAQVGARLHFEIFQKF